MNVLLVEDSHLVAERLEEMLTGTSDAIRVVWCARSVDEGKQALHCVRPDVVILDIQLPGGSGIDVLEEAKRLRPSPVVIMLTNYPLAQYRSRCSQAGADFFFDKSTQFERVSEVLLRMLPGTGTDAGKSPVPPGSSTD